MKLLALEPASRDGEPRLLGQMEALADLVRCRMLLALERHELTVSELCAVLQLPQSTVSRHLKTLSDEGWVGSRREGTSRYYSAAVDDLDESGRRLWPLVREQVAATAAARQDARRLESVLARRRATSEAFFSTASRRWDRLRAELFGTTCHLHALLALIDPALVVGDLGCGTGQVSVLLAPHVARVVGVDSSPDMLEAARARAVGLSHVEFRRGSLEALPLGTGELDAAVMALVLHHVPDPARAFAECARVLRPGGRVLVVDMFPHDRAEYRQQMGHIWLGFPETQVRKLLAGAGFTGIRLQALPVDPHAKGPALFAAVGTNGS